MGTRNSTLVKLNGEYKVAQYGQWDGYPTGQGAVIAEFLRNVDLPKFKKQVAALEKVNEKEVEEFLKSIGAANGWLDSEQAEKYNEKYPELSRDTGAGVLQLIHDGKATSVRLYEDFKDDTLFCEYWYELDLDRETITMNNRTFTFEEWKQEGFQEKLEREE